ncbi:YidB family protein [Acinetobacter stercoris]|uniref:DUF937 domain-containing protein n=1 Tax=Acinetobacter stercoris TaxID=2126983 RepID=A0A2U3MZM1_9GAMM|nr:MULTISPECIES: YidB family protein [Acinetobacter]SPL70868.1 hypothetical protein KPC_2046 [Acinetobacter stercoris]
MTNLSNIVEILAQQALGGQQQSGQEQGGLGGILGSVLGQVTGGQQQAGQGGLGGILGSVLGQFTGGSQQGGGSALLVAVVPLILNWIQGQGGLQGALAKLQNAGLGGQVQSWVDPDQSNNEAAVGQIQNLFNTQDVEQVASQVNVPTDQVYGAISSVLPQIIDSLTPQGDGTDDQEANADIQKVLGLVSGFLK